MSAGTWTTRIGGHGRAEPIEGQSEPEALSAAKLSALFLGSGITLAPKKLIRTRRASEGSTSEPSLARRVSMSMCKDAKLSCRGNSRVTLACCKVGLDRPLIPTAFVAICFVRRGSPDLPFGRPEVSR